MDLLSPDLGLIFWTIITFLVLMFILRKTAWKPVMKGLEHREKSIKESLNNAETARSEAEKLLEEQKKMLAEARNESQKLIDNARKAAEVNKQEILAQAKAEADQVLAAAKKEIGVSRDKALLEIRKVAADLSVAIASKMISRTLDKKDHIKLIEESLQEFDRMS